MKSGYIVIDSPKEFVDYASQLVPLITSLYFSVEEFIVEVEEVARAKEIRGTLKIHKVIRKYNNRNICYLRFSNLFQPLDSSVEKMMIPLFLIKS